MQFKRMFSTDAYKGTSGYLRTQKNYEILRTVLYFAISLSLFIAGWVTTGSRENLLTIVAVLGCLPACKSIVNLIMLCRAKGCSREVYEQIKPCEGRLIGMCDLYFTSYQKNFPISHMVVDGKVTRDSKIRVLRDGIILYEGEIGSLKRFKDDAKEVTKGFECGMQIENYNDIKE